VTTHNVVDSEEVLRKLGYEYVLYVDQESEPRSAHAKFSDILPCLKEPYASFKLYLHQEQAIKALSKGKNVILVAGTGSGKTEAWALYAIRKAVEDRKFKVLAIYPTIALESDQGFRLQKYCEQCRLKILKLDRKTVKGLEGEGILQRELANSQFILTNPAFFMVRVKNGFKDKFKELKNIKLFVVDELDYYGSKRATLLIKLLETVIKKFLNYKSPQIVILSATLANHEVLKRWLEDITGRETEIISGEPFKTKSKIYIILGKRETVRKIFNDIIKLKSDLVKYLQKDLIDKLNDYEEFKKNIFKLRFELEKLTIQDKVIQTASSILNILPDIDVPELVAELLQSYENENYVTIVYERSINQANKLVSSVKDLCREKYGRDCNVIITPHHHIVSRKDRSEIERRLREGTVKMVVTVRTLIQGIDIGTVVRTIHIGLPKDVKEFLQKEGRRGRRKDITHSECIIIPITNWQYLIEGLKMIKKLGLEIEILNRNNEYLKLFESLLNVKHGINLKQLPKDEYALLSKLKLTDKNEIEKVWSKFNFYEMDRPRPLRPRRPRYVISIKGINEPVESEENDISLKDYVEKFQVGYIDHLTNAIVISNRRPIKERYVRQYAVEAEIEWLLKNQGIPIKIPDDIGEVRVPKAIINAIETYKDIKYRWHRSHGEPEPNFLKDVVGGKVWSEIILGFQVFGDGFTRIKEIPLQVFWIVESKQKYPIKISEDITIYQYLREKIPIEYSTYGMYEDFTYAYVIDLDPDDIENFEDLELGFTYLKALLRKHYRIELDLLGISIIPPRTTYIKLNGLKLLLIYEKEATGLIELLKQGKLKIENDILNCYKIFKLIELNKLDDVDLILMQLVDDYAIYKINMLKTRQKSLNDYAMKALMYICPQLAVNALTEIFKSKGVEKDMSKTHQRIASLDIVFAELCVEDKCEDIFVTTIYDGNSSRTVTTIEDLVKELIQLSISGYTILHYGKDNLIKKVLSETSELGLPCITLRIIDTYKQLCKIVPNYIPKSLTLLAKVLANLTGEVIDLPPTIKLLTLLNEVIQMLSKRRLSLEQVKDQIVKILTLYTQTSSYLIYKLYKTLITQ